MAHLLIDFCIVLIFLQICHYTCIPVVHNPKLTLQGSLMYTKPGFNKSSDIKELNISIQSPLYVLPNTEKRVPVYANIRNHLSGIRVSSRKRWMSPGQYFLFSRLAFPDINQWNGTLMIGNGTLPVQKRMNMPPKIHLIPKSRRTFDVPQIECSLTKEGTERFACPSPDHTNRYRCIEDWTLCDGFIDCPNAEDEDMTSCMFFNAAKTHLDVLADALLRWTRGRN